MRRYLNTKGLSLSQAQSMSNLCNQRCIEIDKKIENINNFSSSVVIEGIKYTNVKAYEIPDNIRDLLLEKSKYHALQAFLMECIRAKDEWLREIDRKVFVTDLEKPRIESVDSPELETEVDEDWGWKQLSASEIAEYLEVEAYASHIGKFIHKSGKLTNLRNELPKLQELQFMKVDDKSIPVKISIHHTDEKLMDIYEILSQDHRKYEQRVNYFKAKVKNLVSQKNSEINNKNGKLISEYNSKKEAAQNKFNKEYNEYASEYRIQENKFNDDKIKLRQKVAAFRIEVQPRFQETVDSLVVIEE